MKPKKSLFFIVIFSFLFITNFVMFSIIQRPLYAEECNYQDCEPMHCELEASRWCDRVCYIENIPCEKVELQSAYCAPTPWWDCECYSLWIVTCEETQSSYYYDCHELSYDCPTPI